AVLSPAASIATRRARASGPVLFPEVRFPPAGLHPGHTAAYYHPRMENTLDIASAVDLLRRGGVIAYPTEAVWGLGCDPADQAAVMRLLEIKQRPVEKGLIVVAA